MTTDGDAILAAVDAARTARANVDAANHAVEQAAQDVTDAAGAQLQAAAAVDEAERAAEVAEATLQALIFPPA